MHDGLSQGAIAGTGLDHMKNGRFPEEVPHLFQLARNQGTESGVAHGRRPEVCADPLAPGRVEASPRRVETDLHELGERNSAMLLNEVSYLLFNR